MLIMGSTISVSRDSGYADRIRAYRVLLDGNEIGRIGNGETKSFDIKPGQHQLALKIDWCGSAAINFGIANDQCVKFQCGSNLRGFRLFLAVYYAIFAWRKYLWLKVA